LNIKINADGKPLSGTTNQRAKRGVKQCGLSLYLIDWENGSLVPKLTSKNLENGSCFQNGNDEDSKAGRNGGGERE